MRNYKNTSFNTAVLLYGVLKLFVLYKYFVIAVRVSAGHPHRNDRKDGFPRTVYYRKKQIFKALAFFFGAFLPFALRQCLLRHIPRLTQLRGLK